MIFKSETRFVDSCLLPRSPEEQKVIQNMTYPSIIFRNSDWGGNFSKKSEIYFYITWQLWVSCNTRFEEEKWELSQLEYSGEMKHLQKDDDMEKTYVDDF